MKRQERLSDGATGLRRGFGVQIVVSPMLNSLIKQQLLKQLREREDEAGLRQRCWAAGTNLEVTLPPREEHGQPKIVGFGRKLAARLQSRGDGRGRSHCEANWSYIARP
jgi:hypothetical protein